MPVVQGACLLIEASWVFMAVALCSAAHSELLDPSARRPTSIMQRRTFSVVGPTVWNGLALELVFQLQKP